MVHGVVVDEGRQVDELDDGSQRERVLSLAAPHRVGQQKERRAEELALHEQEVLVHVLDHLEVRHDDPPDLSCHPVQHVAHGCLDGGELRGRPPGGAAQQRRGVNGGHGDAP